MSPIYWGKDDRFVLIRGDGDERHSTQRFYLVDCDRGIGRPLPVRENEYPLAAFWSQQHREIVYSAVEWDGHNFNNSGINHRLRSMYRFYRIEIDSPSFKPHVVDESAISPLLGASTFLVLRHWEDAAYFSVPFNLTMALPIAISPDGLRSLLFGNTTRDRRILYYVATRSRIQARYAELRYENVPGEIPVWLGNTNVIHYLTNDYVVRLDTATGKQVFYPKENELGQVVQILM